MNKTGYLAAEGCEEDLAAEIAQPAERYGRLFLTEGPARPLAWAQNIWRSPKLLNIQSIKDGASQLKALQRNWALYDFQYHGRARLIEDQLPHVSGKPIAFPSPLPKAPLGSFTLLSENEILASADCSSPFRHGEAIFQEDREGPPNRAYLKLWEALTLLEKRPLATETCLDLGASPGGWSWVLAKLGCRVISIDKAPLSDTVMAFPNVEYRVGSAFALEPDKFEPIDWLLCDVVCYPTRLLIHIQNWIKSGKVKNFVVTLKFQGPTDHASAAAFADIPGSTIRHLHHNKHELTWMKI